MKTQEPYKDYKDQSNVYMYFDTLFVYRDFIDLYINFSNT